MDAPPPILIILVAVIGLVITVVWIVFPFLILGKVSSLIAEVKQTNDHLAALRFQEGKPPAENPQLELIERRIDYTNRLLEWLGKKEQPAGEEQPGE
jgi:predicted PurR-regulated permease PerM